MNRKPEVINTEFISKDRILWLKGVMFMKIMQLQYIIHSVFLGILMLLFHFYHLLCLVAHTNGKSLMRFVMQILAVLNYNKFKIYDLKVCSMFFLGYM